MGCSLYELKGVKGFLEEKLLNESKKAQSILKPKIISQRLVAHIQNPIPHLKITSTIDKSGNILSVDTVENTILKDDNFLIEYICAILNSKAINWYTYKFIFCSAIRTMDLDNYYIGKIPIPKIPKLAQKPFETLVNKITEKKNTAKTPPPKRSK